MHRGSIWWADLPAPSGSNPGYRRPVVIVQADAFNASRIRTVIVAAITSNLRLADAPGNVFLSPDRSGLPRESVINVSQLITLDQDFLTEKITDLSPRMMKRVDDGLRIVLDLFE
jgi:mRNA interferase MazF